MAPARACGDTAVETDGPRHKFQRAGARGEAVTVPLLAVAGGLADVRCAAHSTVKRIAWLTSLSTSSLWELRAAITYMREHVAEPISVEDVAGKVGLSRAHFFSLFRDQLSTTPQVFWSAVRVEEVVRRLVLREEPLTSVAMELGFSSPGNFSRFFKEHMGVSPSRFRRAATGPESHPITGLA